MYSKPKAGMYYKKNDRQRGGMSPRREEKGTQFEGPMQTSTFRGELEKRDSPEGRISPQVEVQQYGEGNISAEISPQWPQRNFEAANVYPYQDTPSTQFAFPQRAEKYVVEGSGTISGVINRKITVPQSGRTYKRGEGTVKVHPKRDRTLKSYPIRDTPDGTIRGFPMTLGDGTVRSYSLGHLATIRDHHLRGPSRPVTSIHQAFQQGRRSPVGWENSQGTMPFRRAVIERKEHAINAFAIELDHSDAHVYSPGEELSGKLVLETIHKIDIRFVELIIVGVATVQHAKTDPKHSKVKREVTLSKRSYVMGTPDGRYNSIIMPGRYVSNFRFLLPPQIPSTIKYEDIVHGFGFDVTYMVKARICDEIGSSSIRSTHSMNHYVKVLLSRRHLFRVQRPFDIHAIPNALNRVHHSEEVDVDSGCCGLFGNGDQAKITLSLDRSVFLAGDEIHVRLESSTRNARRIKSLTCELQQWVVSGLNNKTRLMNVIAHVEEQKPEGTLKRNTLMYEFIIPTQMNFIPTFLRGCQILQVSYVVIMSVHFRGCGGKLDLEIPIGLGPCTDPSKLEKRNSVPFFNRPRRFPSFTPSQEKLTQTEHKMQNGAIGGAPKPRQVSSKYSGGGCLLCLCPEST